jgi:hypothetical protein
MSRHVFPTAPSPTTTHLQSDESVRFANPRGNARTTPGTKQRVHPTHPADVAGVRASRRPDPREVPRRRGEARHRSATYLIVATTMMQSKERRLGGRASERVEADGAVCRLSRGSSVADNPTDGRVDRGRCVAGFWRFRGLGAEVSAEHSGGATATRELKNKETFRLKQSKGERRLERPG